MAEIHEFPCKSSSSSLFFHGFSPSFSAFLLLFVFYKSNVMHCLFLFPPLNNGYVAIVLLILLRTKRRSDWGSISDLDYISPIDLSNTFRESLLSLEWNLSSLLLCFLLSYLIQLMQLSKIFGFLEWVWSCCCWITLASVFLNVGELLVWFGELMICWTITVLLERLNKNNWSFVEVSFRWR